MQTAGTQDRPLRGVGGATRGQVRPAGPNQTPTGGGQRSARSRRDLAHTRGHRGSVPCPLLWRVARRADRVASGARTRFIVAICASRTSAVFSVAGCPLSGHRASTSVGVSIYLCWAHWYFLFLFPDVEIVTFRSREGNAKWKKEKAKGERRKQQTARS